MNHVDPELLSLLRWVLGGLGGVFLAILAAAGSAIALAFRIGHKVGDDDGKLRLLVKIDEKVERLPQIEQMVEGIDEKQRRLDSAFPRFKEEVRDNLHRFDIRQTKVEQRLGVTPSSAAHQATRPKFGSQPRIPRGDREE